MPDAKINGTEIYYEVHGEGPPIVLAHGVGGNHAIWWQQTAYLQQWYQVITFDHRGFGRSKEIPEGPDMGEYVQDLVELLDHLKIEKAALVGQSMGGIAVLGMTAWHPERVHALVMTDTPGGLSHDSLKSFMDPNSEWRQKSEKLIQIDRAVSKGFQKREPGLSLLFLQVNSFNKANRFNLRGRDYKGPTPEEVIKSKVPLLWILGQEDMVLDPEMVRACHKLVPGSTLVEVHGSGHSVYWERPGTWNHIVREFLEKNGYYGKGD